MIYNILNHGRIVTKLEEEEQAIGNVTMDDVQSYLADILKQDPVIVLYGQTHAFHSYDDFVKMKNDAMEIGLA